MAAYSDSEISGINVSHLPSISPISGRIDIRKSPRLPTHENTPFMSSVYQRNEAIECLFPPEFPSLRMSDSITLLTVKPTKPFN